MEITYVNQKKITFRRLEILGVKAISTVFSQWLKFVNNRAVGDGLKNVERVLAILQVWVQSSD